MKLGKMLFFLVSLSSAHVGAQTVSSGQISFLSFNTNSVEVSVVGLDGVNLTDTSQHCVNEKVFSLAKSHANYEALSAALLTYFHQKRQDVTLTLLGCRGEYPEITQVSAD